ncbi:MAG TPA: tetratricopeptide repeat protein [Pyrinomonadaceae bacterium]|nr:tetratricopeptide repeat protein [Pyrinomonadaceae bacterium]
MFAWARRQFSSSNSLAVLILLSILMCAGGARAQETGGDLLGGAGIFRPKNPEAKRSGHPSRPVARPTRPTRPSPAEIEARFEDALSDGNDARDARKYTAAETAYRSAIKLKPRDARGSYGLGNVFADQQRWDEAEKAYREALSASPVNAEALMALSFVLVQPRTGAINAKRFADAEDFARRATQLQPNNGVAFDRLGVAMVARGIFNSDAEAAFRRALELDPNFVVAQVHLARVLRHMNRFSEADPLYNSAIEQAKDAPTLVLIADAMETEQRWNDSEPVLRRALELDAKNPGALFLLGRVMTVNRRYAEAESVFKRAGEVNPKSFQVQNLLGRAYLGLERYDDAFRTYERAAELASDADRKQLGGAFGFGGVGDGFMSAGRTRDAVRAYDRALQLDPNNSDVQQKAAAARAKGPR